MSGDGNRSRSVLVVTLAAGILVAVSVLQGNTALADAYTTTGDFFRALEGRWVGKAEVTPIGPRPYDITFAPAIPARLEGHAEPGGAIHYWAFYEEAGGLRLRFLSTFAGNQTPVHLDAVDWQEDGVMFQARKPSFLKVLIKARGEQLDIDVLHNEQLHVAIRLARQ